MRLTRLVACLVLFVVSLAMAQRPEMTVKPVASPQPGFDPQDVVRHVRSAADKVPGDVRQLFDDGEFLIDTSITLFPALYAQSEPAVAFDGANFLVVWEDKRDGMDDYSDDIFGARVTPNGTVLDSCGIPIARAANIQGHPAIAFDGANFLVVWEDHRNGGYDIYGARVTPAGTVLDPSGIPVCRAAGNQYAPDVAFTGTGFLVVWRDYRNGVGYDIYGTRVTADGVVLDTAGIAISTAAHDQMEPAVAFDGTNSLVVWQDERTGDRDLYGARVTSTGVVLDSMGIPISRAPGYQSVPAVAFDGRNFLVVWNDARGGDGAVYGSRVTPAGVVLDTAGIAIPTAAVHQIYPAVAFDGTDFLVAWQKDSLDIYAARVTSNGVVLDSTGILVSNATPSNQWYPAVATDGTNSIVIWGGLSGDASCDIFGARVADNGALLDTLAIAISGAANIQGHPDVASDGQDFLVVWEDARGADGDIYGARVTQAGVVLDPAGIDLSPAVGGHNPAVAFDGTDYLVVWVGGRNGESDIYGTRVTPAGVVLDTAGIPVSLGANEALPAVAFDGANFLVAWERWSGSAPSDIYGARVTPDGIVLDPSGFDISQAENYQYQPAVMSDGVNSLVVWTDQRSGSEWDIYGARVTPAGTVLDPSGIVISQAANDQYLPALGFDGANFLAAWTDERGAHIGDTSDIYGTRVTPTGVVLDPQGIHIAQADHSQERPAVAFDGADFVVMWEDQRSGWYEDVCGALVSQSGVVSDSGLVVEQNGYQEQAALARGSGGQLFLAYQGWAGTVGGKVYNIYRTWGKLGPLLGVAEKTPNSEQREASATIIRSVLCLPAKGEGRMANSELLDISGRKVLDLHPGPNDVRALAPGVYFVREKPQATSLKPQAVRKVVVQ